MPRRRPYQFMPTRDFTATVRGSLNHYFAGHPYTVRVQPIHDPTTGAVVGDVYDELATLVENEWEPKGMVQIL